jgi:arylsulfatase A-like enzyme/Flp pilus assembly protein TadD
MLSIFTFWRFRSPSPSAQNIPTGFLRGHNLLLITIDTLRADMLGTNGNPDGLTPNLDQWATEGIRFPSAFAHATMTLPSHCSILTGEYPIRHGVRDNGLFRLETSRLTLAEILKKAGYRTGAFIGAFVLDTRFGLSQGFDLYDVLLPAAAWLEQEDSRPWFAWIHLFDPHVPYEPPDPYRERYREQPYAGEVAYTDDELGVFLDRLRSAGRLDDTVLVVTADHGESLGEHGEKTHGAFAYNSTLHVPLILWAAPHLEPQVFSETVSHVDMVPTVLELLGVTVPDSVQGTTLLPRLNRQVPAGNRPIYFETLHPYLTQNLAPLTGLIDGEYKYIDLPLPELYHLSQDPRETANLFADESGRARELGDKLKKLVETLGADTGRDIDTVPLDEEGRKRLEALGYIVTASPPTKTVFTAADDPKNAIEHIENQRAAMSLHASGDSEKAISLLLDVIKEREDFTAAYMNLAVILMGTGRLSEAVSVMEAAAQRNPDNASVLSSLGAIYSEVGESEKAVRVLKKVLEKAPNDVNALNAIGVAYANLGKNDDALASFERALELAPSSSNTLNNLGTFHLRRQDFPNAIERFRKAIELAPGFWSAYDGLSTALMASGQLSEAVEAWKQMVELDPRSYDALYNLGVALVELRRDAEALVYIERFLREAPTDRYSADKTRLERLAADVRKEEPL